MMNFKKIAALFTAVALSMGLSVTTFAANPITSPGGSDSKAVTGSYQAGSSADTTYKVDITWGNMEFVYKAADEGQWNPDTHTYSGGQDAGWSSESSDITVKNHSNKALVATLEFSPETGYEGVSGSFTNNNLSLASAADVSFETPDNAPTETVNLSLSGDPERDFGENQTIGTVKITINDAE